jgi:hypothetical protein
MLKYEPTHNNIGQMTTNMALAIKEEQENYESIEEHVRLKDLQSHKAKPLEIIQ